MSVTDIPRQFSSSVGTVSGLIDGSNDQFGITPFPQTLLFSEPDVISSLLFRNGLLIGSGYGYNTLTGTGHFGLNRIVGGDILTSYVFPSTVTGGITRLLLSKNGIQAFGTKLLYLSPYYVVWNSISIPFMLFRNGQLLTKNSDYTVNGPWINLSNVQRVRPGDIFIVLIDMNGSSCSTVDGSITGTADSVNATFGMPFGLASALVFRNGVLQTEGYDYIIVNAPAPGPPPVGPGGPALPNEGLIGQIIPGFQAVTPIVVTPPPVIIPVGAGPALPGEGLPGSFLPGFGPSSPLGALNVIVFLPGRIPRRGDTITAQIYELGFGGPVQKTTVDQSLYYTPTSKSLLFFNGLLMTQPQDAVTSANTAVFAKSQTPDTGDIVALDAWTEDVDSVEGLPFNLPLQFTTNDGSIIGALNGANSTFLLATGSLITQIMLTWNGDFLTYGIDYAWSCLQNSSAGPWVTSFIFLGALVPNPGDLLTAEAFLQ